MRVLAVVHQPDAGLGVFAQPLSAGGHEILEWTPADSGPPPRAVGAAIVLGGAMHPDQEAEHPWLRGEKEYLRSLLDARTPLLGVCLGAELVAEAAGAPARRMDRPEVGWREILATPEARPDPVFGALPERFWAFEWHSYETPLPPGATALAAAGARVDAFRLGEAWGIQFHAEVTAEIVRGWIASYREDPDLEAVDFDPDAARAELEPRIADSEEVGARLCERFLRHAAAPAEA